MPARRGMGSGRAKPSVAARRRERELFFWTARQTLATILLTALTADTVIALADGRPPSAYELLDALRRTFA
ncbi:MAG: hypothetical protein M3340_03785 [Actinomycetota bacterium]|nr:hypothetical protein [Actinomycetota bacterium]